MNVNAGQKWLVTEKWDLPINGLTKVTVSSRFDMAALLNDPKKTTFTNGMAVEFKL